MSGLGAAFAVLMVGHSLFAMDGPDMLQGALRAGMGDATVRAQIINGAPLRYNWENSDNAEGVDARSVLPEGAITHLILTEAVPLRNHTQWSETDIYGPAFARLAFSANPAARVYVQETWHDLNSGTGVEVQFDTGADVPWRTRLDQDLPVWEGVVESIAAGNSDHADRVHLIPAGQALARLHDEIVAEKIEGITDVSALFADGIHLNDTGHYFVSMVQYAVLTGQDPLGLPTDFSNRWGGAFDTPDADLARALQRVAWAAVRAYQGNAATSVSPAAPSDIASATTTPTAPRAPSRTTLPTTPAADLTQAPAQAVAGTNHVAIGLASVVDWSTQQPFLNIFKTARNWIGHKPGAWGGMTAQELRDGGYVDADGWPLRMPRELSSIGTLILTNIPEAAQSLAGRYVLRYTGKGIIEVGGRAKNVRYGKGEIRFSFTPGPGSVDIRLQRINTSAPLRITSVVKEDMLRVYDRGQQFNPAWTTLLGSFRALRFMDWIEANNSTLAAWDARPMVNDHTYSTAVPIEVMIDLANTLEKDAWFNVPHLADDDFIRQFATLVKDRLDPKLKVYVEFSNEVWNWGFKQAAWADDSALDRWGERDKWMQYYGLRASESARIWTDVFAEEADARLINVIATHTGWMGLESEALEASLVVAEGSPAPVTAFDAYAVTGYFSGGLGGAERDPMIKDWLAKSLVAAQEGAAAKGLSGTAAETYVAKHRYDTATAFAARELRDGAISGDPGDTLSNLIGRFLPYHAEVARTHGLSLIMYEGGTHVVGNGGRENDEELTAFFMHLNYTPEMGALYETLLQGWKAVGGQLFNAYLDVGAPTKWGSWGTLRHLDDTNPRWDALVNFQ
jgi:hypothetical protein